MHSLAVQQSNSQNLILQLLLLNFCLTSPSQFFCITQEIRDVHSPWFWSTRDWYKQLKDFIDSVSWLTDMRQSRNGEWYTSSSQESPVVNYTNIPQNLLMPSGQHLARIYLFIYYENQWVSKSFTSGSTHHRSLQRQVFPGNQLHWYWQPD